MPRCESRKDTKDEATDGTWQKKTLKNVLTYTNPDMFYAKKALYHRAFF